MAILKSVASAAYPTGVTIVDPVNPVSIPNGAKGVFQLTVQMDEATYTSPDTNIGGSIEIFKDGVWRFDAGFTFVGPGRLEDKHGNPVPFSEVRMPGFRVDIAEYAGLQARGVIANSGSSPVTLGLLIERL